MQSDLYTVLDRIYGFITDPKAPSVAQIIIYAVWIAVVISVIVVFRRRPGSGETKQNRRG